MVTYLTAYRIFLSFEGILIHKINNKLSIALIYYMKLHVTSINK